MIYRYIIINNIMNFSKQSKQLKKLSKEDKKNNGIYFTPPSIIAKMMKILFPYLKKYYKCVRTFLWFW